MALCRRPHQRCLPAPRFGGVHVRTVVKQQLDDIQRTRTRCRHQSCLALGQHRVGVGSGHEETLHDGGVSVRARKGERTHAVSICRIHVGSGGQHHLDDGRVVSMHGPVERRRAVRLGGSHVGAAGKGGTDPDLVDRADRGDQAGVSLGRDRRNPAGGQQEGHDEGAQSSHRSSSYSVHPESTLTASGARSPCRRDQCCRQSRRHAHRHHPEA